MAETAWNIANLYTAMLDSFKEHMPCEVEGHDSDPGHSGIGEWYVTHVCSSCNTSGVELVCAGFVEMMGNNLDMSIPCVECEEYTTLGDAIIDLTER